ncbi:MAG: hypothetical protein ACR2QB_03795, partial [Gammaproteobacteria bacterium]
MTIARTLFVLTAIAALTACITPKAADVTGDQSQLEIRQIQTREYEALDKRMAMRSTVATLQDLGFSIDNAEFSVGTITATRHRARTMRMTVTTREQPGERIAV